MGNQLDLMKESLEVNGNIHPRCMTVPDRIRLIDAANRVKWESLLSHFRGEQVAFREAEA
ncbi:hypothetical protein A3C20_01630 [Candidatus Kaiserbacteria bacterium RIFCSPHIGHO2_02_FULL_55_25]|uniref:Uncharacterized protein n=1 Tax=Candidatus Kaiserbacteria bacterium RIFCSPHIGHO2_02_FULL_55_25 TaxID=1798498 RepID=A0A1F6E5L6_9BACT|nr:MAG: hypothetical protein A3C20_01630 [Candidatus Kaiserbacteria bacterium RIFCSPHIGHO2_02_FULL_55_25]OGG77884.1 MAG: hypothetical protein A3F56_03695 [Candidatus Kaiserbacteria bacterium RIFCSPHIGHO2_12_FULL_55_13]OGG83068.1 MAG: hypothetical protein A3A42_04600 [Candidatus Kaiserbacteria bacterium RIFCSPLOWO2_01_FULL_55_25]